LYRHGMLATDELSGDVIKLNYNTHSSSVQPRSHQSSDV
jgi:hypothetical protein